MKLVAGTDKGLLVYCRVDEKWTLQDIHFIGMPIGYFHFDERNGAWCVAVNHKHWGPKLYRSLDEGETFKELAAPQFNNGNQQSVRSIWTISHGQYDDPQKFYIGVEPATIFITKDGGENFSELTGLSEHPSRSSWQGGGKGSPSPFLHTILVDAEDTNHLIVGISCAGIFQTFDGGETWNPTNDGLEAFYLPNSSTEIGHDPHTIKIPTSNPNVMWQQNHCGIYRSENKGLSWKNMTDLDGLAGYGFSLVADDENDQVAWVIPAESDHQRIPHQAKLAVYKTIDAGKSWRGQRNGLPQNGAFDLVLRAGFDGRNGHLAFGTNNGNLYYSDDSGENWQIISQNLSAVRSVSLI